MQSAPFIPVDIFGPDGYVYSRTNSYTLEYLQDAYELVKLGKHLDTEPNTPITDIVAAYRYWQVAKESLFCFHPIFGLYADREIAFVSDMFDSTCIVVDAQTLTLYVASQYWMQRNLQQMVNKYVDDVEFHNLIKAYHALSTSPAKCATAVVVDRNESTEYLSIAPYLLRKHNSNSIFEPAYYDALVHTFNTAESTQYFDMDTRNQCIISKDGSEEYDVKDVPYIISIHDRTYATKSDYVEVMTADSGNAPRYYVSKDYKHLVDASTFMSYLIRFPALQEFLRHIAEAHMITDKELVYLTEMLERIYEKED